MHLHRKIILYNKVQVKSPVNYLRVILLAIIILSGIYLSMEVNIEVKPTLLITFI
jgi:hypothetical protein